MNYKDLEPLLGPKYGIRKPWIGVDLDRTLAHYESWEKNRDSIGEPVKEMIYRVKTWLKAGVEVRIFTARANKLENFRFAEDFMRIEAWCEKHIGQKLKVTCSKDFDCIALIDDIAISVVPNSGEFNNVVLHLEDPLADGSFTIDETTGGTEDKSDNPEELSEFEKAYTEWFMGLGDA
jgi:hypothetical protein